MKKKILALYDSEKDYLESLARFLKEKEELPFALHAYTEKGKLLASAKKEKIEVLMVAETDFTYEIAGLETGKTLLLNESGTVKDTRLRNIDKYQKAENIWRELMDSYADMLTGEKQTLTGKGSAKIIGMYSPVRRCLQTSFALTLGQVLAEKKKTLYISFEHYAGWNRLLDKNVRGDLAALLYFAEEQGEKFFCRMQSMTLKIGQLYYIPPAYAGQNLIYVKGQDWQKLLRKIAEEGGYDYIILDLSESIQGTFELLRMCDRIYTLVREDEQAQAKLLQYEELLREYDYEDVLDKTDKQLLPQFTGLPERMEQYTGGELAAYVRKLIKEDLEPT
ncbi:MAG: hypothetical protein IJ405_08415 [Lachnospiraceae bacterium]|nr:hypothetical protein [Lachnospiraceae bacterium]MBQ7782029.1 hypothetical protein [Lachnospiraceae bacterium]